MGGVNRELRAHRVLSLELIIPVSVPSLLYSCVLVTTSKVLRGAMTLCL